MKMKRGIGIVLAMAIILISLPTVVNGDEIVLDTYAQKVAASLKPEMKVSDWATIRAASECGIDLTKYTIVEAPLTPVANAMKNVFMLNNKESKYLLATQKDFMIKAGAYAMDYCLMALDSKGYWAYGEKLAESLSDWEASTSLRDDVVYSILNTAGCWGGAWFTLDTGCQNAQALVPYSKLYPEVKQKLDEVLNSYYAQIMSVSYKDASSAGEFIRFAAIYGDIQKASDVYKKFVDLGEANWKYKGNATDIQRMALGESALSGKYTIEIYTSTKPSKEGTDSEESKEYLFTVTVDDKQIKKPELITLNQGGLAELRVKKELFDVPDGMEFGGAYYHGKLQYTYIDGDEYVILIKGANEDAAVELGFADEAYFIDVKNGGVKQFDSNKVYIE